MSATFVCGLILIGCLSPVPRSPNRPGPSSPETTLWARKPPPAGKVTILPLFSPVMSCPEFRVTFANASDQATDGLNVFLHESIRLDGNVYPRLLVRWAGPVPQILSRGRWSHTLAVGDFLPRERMPGEPPLAAGTHTILVIVGQATSEELTFAWRP